MKIIFDLDGVWASISVAPGFDLEWVIANDLPEWAADRYEIVEDDDPRLTSPPLKRPARINNAGLVRFTGATPPVVLEAIRMVSVTRVAKGRYRASHEESMPSDQYSAAPSVFDASPRLARITARTEAYVEIRVTDLSGVAQDAAEIMLKTERVIYP